MSLPERKNIRLKNFNYNSNGAYFITICTKEREHLLSNVEKLPNETIGINLCDFGQIADKYLLQMRDFYDGIELENYIIMPNHIHMLFRIYDINVSDDVNILPTTL